METTFVLVGLCLMVLATLPGSFGQTSIPENGLLFSLFPGQNQGAIRILHGDIKTIAANNGATSTLVTFSAGNVMITTFATDPVEGNVHFIDVQTNSIYRIDNFTVLVNHPGVNVKRVHKGLSRAICKLAYDYITGNIYWTDPLYHRISVHYTFSTDINNNKVLINNHLDYPVAIAIDPSVRLLFWSNSLSSGTIIESSFLDGTNRGKVVSARLVYVDDMIADVHEQNLYWFDSYRRTVETCAYNGSGRRPIRRDVGTEYTSMTLIDDLLCVASYDAGYVSCFYKSSGETMLYASTVPNYPYGVSIYDKKTYKAGPDYCKNKQCDGFCLNGPNDGVCTCRDGYTLQTDKKSCKADHPLHARAIVIANTTNICTLDLAVITGKPVEPLCISENMDSVSLIDYSFKDKVLYYYNQTNKQIWSVDLVTDNKLVITDVGDIDDMAFDWVNDDMYTVYSSTGEIIAYSLKNLPQVEFTTRYSNLIKPREIVVDPHRNAMYWIAEGGIYKGSFDGKTPIVMVGKEETIKPSALFYDYHYDEVFWMDEAKGSLFSIKNDGTNIQHWLFTSPAKHLAIYKDYAIWTNGKEHLYSTIYGVDAKVNLHDITIFGTITAMTVMDDSFQKPYPSPCSVPLNGGCEHLCFPVNDTTAVCECDFGFTQHANKKNCTTTPFKTDFLLFTDLAHDRIYQVSLDGSDVRTLDIPNAFVPAMVQYEPKSERIYWSDVGSKKIKSATLTGETEKTVFSIGEGYPDRFTFDQSTGHLYFTVTDISTETKKGYIAVTDPNFKDNKHKTLIKELDFPSGIAVHPKEGLLFYNNHNANDVYIGRANMDGTNIKKIITSNIGIPLGMAIDYSTNKLYWTEAHRDVIEVSSLNGNNRMTLTEYKLGDPVHLTISGGMLYTVGYNLHSIKKFNLKTNKKETFMKDYVEFGPLDSVDIYPSTNVQPGHIGCATNNGGCQYYCLPTPNGGVCGCPDGLVRSGAGGKTCGEPLQTCLMVVQNGKLSATCTGKKNTQCTYECNPGFAKNPQYPTITCNEDLDWNAPTYALCQPNTCKLSLPNGQFGDDCTGKIGSACNYTCDNGYLQNPKYMTVKCTDSLLWDVTLSALCLQTCNNLNIPNGDFWENCTGQIGESCGFTCDPGFTVNPALSLVTCTQSRNWNYPADTLCVKPAVQCPLNEIENGVLSNGCQGIEKETCSYTCNANFEPKDASKDHITCLSTGKWTLDTATLCVKQQYCPAVVKNGNLTSNCQRTRGSICGFTCNNGYERSSKSLVKLVCGTNYQWDYNLDKLCSGTPTVAEKQTGGKEENTAAIAGMSVVIVLLIVIIVIAIVFFVLRRKALLEGGKQQGVYRASPNVYFNSNEISGQGGVTGFSNPVAHVNGDTLPNTNPLSPDQVVITTQAEATALPEKQNMENMAAYKTTGGVYETIKDERGVPNPLYSELHPSEEMSYKNEVAEEEQQPTKPGNVYQRFK